MSTEVVMPQMGESITEGTVSKWLKQVGERVEKDEALLEISTDKVDAEVPSPSAGVLLEVRTQEGETVEVGTVVAVIGEESEVGSQQSAVGDQPQAPVVEAPQAAAPQLELEAIPIPDVAAPVQTIAPSNEQPSASDEQATEVVMPQMGESITEGTVSKWLKSVGDTIEKDEALLEISTDKVDAEVPSPAGGTLLAINVQEGETVEVGSVLALVGAGSGVRLAASAASSQPVVAAPTVVVEDACVPEPIEAPVLEIPASRPCRRQFPQWQRPAVLTVIRRSRNFDGQNQVHLSAISPGNTGSTSHAFRAVALAAE